VESEIIVVLVLIAFAVGFIIWVRIHSQAQNAPLPRESVNREDRATKES